MAIMERCAWSDVVLTVLVTSVTRQGFVWEDVSQDGPDTFVRVRHYYIVFALTFDFIIYHISFLIF